MVVLDKTLALPDSPQTGWGVELRKLTIRDFRGFLIFLSLIVPLGVTASLPESSNIMLGHASLSEASFFLGCVLSFFSLFALGFAFSNRREEACSKARAKSKEWQKNVLIPYLEKKYGMTVMSDNLFGWNYPYARIGNKSIKFAFHGVAIDTDYRFGESYSFRNFVVGREIWAEEVVEPEKVSFRPLPVVTENM